MTKKITVKSQPLCKNRAATHMHCDLSLLERKLFNVLLLNSYEELLEDKLHSIDLNTAALLAGYDSHDMKKLRAAIRNLGKASFEWNMLEEDDSPTWAGAQFISEWKWQKGVFYYRHPQSLAQLLYKPDRFDDFHLSVQNRFQSKFALALYENCRRYATNPSQSTGFKEIVIWRKLLNCDTKYYHTFKFFFSKILTPAITEINKHSDILIAHNPKNDRKRAGRSISELRFTVKENPQLTLIDLIETSNLRESKICKALEKLGFKTLVALNLIQEHGQEFLAPRIQRTMTMKKAGKIKTTASAYLSSLIKNPEWTTDIEVDHERLAAHASTQSLKSRLDELDGLYLKIERLYNHHCWSIIDQHFDNLDKTSQQIFLEEFQKTLDSDWLIKDFEKDRWRSRLLTSTIRDFWSEQQAKLLPKLESFALEQGCKDWKKNMIERDKLKNSV